MALVVVEVAYRQLYDRNPVCVLCVFEAYAGVVRLCPRTGQCVADKAICRRVVLLWLVELFTVPVAHIIVTYSAFLTPVTSPNEPDQVADKPPLRMVFFGVYWHQVVEKTPQTSQNRSVCGVNYFCSFGVYLALYTV